MQAIAITAHGGPSALVPTTLPTPPLGPHSVAIRIAAAGVNHVDIDVRNGTAGIESIQSLPHIPGVDCAGTISEVGSAVTRWKVGDHVVPHFILHCGTCDSCRAARENMCPKGKVLGLTAWGCYAERVVVEEQHCVEIPQGVGMVDAAAGLTPYATAWEALVLTAGLRAGERVLITGAGGGVGSHAVQVARLCGAEVVAAVGGQEKAKRVKELGAQHVVDYTAEDLADGVLRVTRGRGVDVVLDGIGGEVLQSCLKAVAEGGRIAVIGAHGGEKVEIDMIQLFRRHVSLLGCGRSTLRIYETVLGLMASGQLKPVVHKVFPLDKAAEAQMLMESRKFFGRIVLQPEDNT